MPQNFILFCGPRMGSYSLMSRLNSCPDTICHGEVFKKNLIEISKFHASRVSYKNQAARDSDPIGFINELRSINRHKNFGFKFFHLHLSWAPDVVHYLKAPETRRVILYRNPLEAYASALRARATGIWTLREDRAAPQEDLNRKVTYSRKTLKIFADNYNRFLVLANVLAELPGSHVIHYDQINDPGAIDALLDFVGSKTPASKTQTAYRKQFTGSLEDSFANWDALQAAIGERYPFTKGPAASYDGVRQPVPRKPVPRKTITWKAIVRKAVPARLRRPISYIRSYAGRL